MRNQIPSKQRGHINQSWVAPFWWLSLLYKKNPYIVEYTKLPIHWCRISSINSTKKGWSLGDLAKNSQHEAPSDPCQYILIYSCSYNILTYLHTYIHTSWDALPPPGFCGTLQAPLSGSLSTKGWANVGSN